MVEDLPEVLALLRQPGARGFLATLVSVEGSSYRRTGARLVWWEDGRRAGGISGGCLEEDIIAHGREAAASGLGKVLEYRTDREGDLVFGTGTGCDGTLHVAVEALGPRPHPLAYSEAYWARGERVWAYTWWKGQEVPATHMAREAAAIPAGTYAQELLPPPELWIFGAGDDAIPLVRGAALLGWRIHIFDTRSASLSPSRIVPALPHLVDPAGDTVLPRAWRPPAVVIMSHRYRDDLVYLRLVAPLATAYVGLLGPRRRAEKLCQEWAEATGGERDALLNRLRAPVGVHLGGEGPRSVALSILAEIQATLHQGTLVRLSERNEPIHRRQA